MTRSSQVVRLSFQALERWEYPLHREFSYDYIGDSEIEAALASPELDAFQLSKSWVDRTDNHSTGADNPIHPLIIAKLVSEFRKGGNAHPIRIEAAEDIRSECGFCVPDGHHRLRALQFLGRSSFEATLDGDEIALKQLLDLESLPEGERK